MKNSETCRKEITIAWKDVHIQGLREPKRNVDKVLHLCASFHGTNLMWDTILMGAKGIVKPGEMLAIMGPSGAGKTSLLGALSYSTKLPQRASGNIAINGCQANAQIISKVSKYVQQKDLFFLNMTVPEHLLFHARLRVESSKSSVEVKMLVDDMIQKFNLPSDDRAISEISGGEMRRLTFATELLSNPMLLFCDEPTSGLDSSMAKLVINDLKKMTQGGPGTNGRKTILCTIHQPSKEVFQTFDKICVLSKGRIAFFGSLKDDAYNFFSTASKEIETHDFIEPSNPADFYLDVLSEDVYNREASREKIRKYNQKFLESSYSNILVKDICDHFDGSSPSQVSNNNNNSNNSNSNDNNNNSNSNNDNNDNNDNTDTSHERISLGKKQNGYQSLATNIDDSDKWCVIPLEPRNDNFATYVSQMKLYKSTWFTQLKCLSRRCVTNYTRNTPLILSDIGLVLITAILGGAIYWRTGQSENKNCKFDQENITVISYCLFFSLTVSVIFSLLNAVMAFPLEIPIFYRDHFASVYPTSSYYLSKLAIDLPINAILPLLHTIIFYSMTLIGCDYLNYLKFWGISVLIANASYSMGHILSIVSSDANMAVCLAAPVIAVEMLFSGFFLDQALRTPKMLVPLKYISVFNYGYDVLMINQWRDVKEIICPEEETIYIAKICVRSGSEILENSKIDPKYYAIYIIMLVVLLVGARLIAFALLCFKSQRENNSSLKNRLNALIVDRENLKISINKEKKENGEKKEQSIRTTCV